MTKKGHSEIFACKNIEIFCKFASKFEIFPWKNRNCSLQKSKFIGNLPGKV